MKPKKNEENGLDDFSDFKSGDFEVKQPLIFRAVAIVVLIYSLDLTLRPTMLARGIHKGLVVGIPGRLMFFHVILGPVTVILGPGG